MTFDVSAVCAFCEQTVASEQVDEPEMLLTMEIMKRKRCVLHSFAPVVRHCRRSDAPPPKRTSPWQSAKGKKRGKTGGSKGHRRGIPSSY